MMGWSCTKEDAWGEAPMLPPEETTSVLGKSSRTPRTAHSIPIRP